MRLALVAAIAAAFAPVAQAGTTATTLVGTVGPGFTISLKTSAGAPVTKLRAGAYSIRVTDKSSDHNFRLSGPGVEKSTEVVYKGSMTWNVKLKAGTYRFKCEPHELIMKGSFKVS